jgi:TolB-like protein/DNA-binding winged helix-turn-helix (wHTH) protein
LAVDVQFVQRVEFAPFELDLRTAELFKQGRKLRLSGQAAQLLVLLVQRAGELVTREELRAALWQQDTFVDFDHGLNNSINRVREVLGDSAALPHYVETLPKQGYRFVAEVCYPPPQVAGTPLPLPTGEATGADLVTPAGPAHVKDVNAGRPGAFSLAVFGTLALLGLVAALVGMNVAGWRDQIFARRPKPNIQALAVLPLANLSGDTEQEFFADGMTEALITELGKISGPRVISRQSVMQYKGSKKSLAEIARELNVDAVIEGAVARSGDRVKVTVHLAQASPERQLWAQEYDRGTRDVLSVEDDIARGVADEIQVELSSQERVRLSRARSVNPEAYADYLRGRSVLAGGLGSLSKLASKRQYTDQDVQTAIAYFKSAIDKDPAYAQPYAGLADAYIHLGNPTWGGHSPKETLSDAKEAATTALKLDPFLPEAHFSLAQTLEYDWNWPEAEKEYNLALKLNPNYVNAHLEYGRFVQALGRNDEALAQMHYAPQHWRQRNRGMGKLCIASIRSRHEAVQQLGGRRWPDTRLQRDGDVSRGPCLG